MHLRPMRETDIDDLRLNCYGGMDAEPARQMLLTLPPGVAEADRFVVVAEDDGGEVVANCTMSRLAHRMCRHRADLGGFVITPRAQGTGLARRLVGYLAEHARHDWGCTILEIACRGGTHAERAYLGLGFTEYARLPAGYDDHGVIYDEVRLFRPL